MEGNEQVCVPRATVPLDMDWTSWGEEEYVSVKSLISNLSAMMTALMTRMNDMDGGTKRRKVAFQGAPLPLSWLPLTMHQEPLLTYQPIPPVRRGWSRTTWEVCHHIYQTAQMR